MIVTDAELNQLDEGVEFIVRTEKDVLDRMNEWCVDQHGKVSRRKRTRRRADGGEQTGLTKSCLESKTSMEEVDKLVTAYVLKHCPDRMALLAGNSVHADMAFLKKVHISFEYHEIPD